MWGCCLKLAKLSPLRHSLLLQPCEVEKIKCACLTENTMDDTHPEQVEKLCLCLSGILITGCIFFSSSASLDYLQAELVSALCS